MDLFKAIEIFIWLKGKLINLPYGINYSGIDSAIPQTLFDSLGLSYGHEFPYKNAFYYATDCRDSRYWLSYLPDIISGEIQAAIILKGYYTDLFINHEISVHAIEQSYTAVDNILESLKFDYS